MDEITPAVGDGMVVAEENTTGFGVAKFAWFRILKNSASELQVDSFRYARILQH